MIIEAKKLIGDMKIVKVEVRDTDPTYDLENGPLRKIYLVNPDMKKLEFLADKILNRFDLEDEEIETIDYIEEYIRENFDVLDTKNVCSNHTIWW